MNFRHRSAHPILALLSILALAIIAGCGGSLQGKQPGKALSEAPPETAALYQSRCFSCHGSELQGRVGNESNLQQVGARLTEDEIVSRIRDGSDDGLMPSFGDQLTEEQIAGLARWLADQS